MKENGIFISIIPQRLKESIKANGLTFERFGSLISKTKQAVSLYCNGKTRPTRKILIEISQILTVPVDYLTGESDVVPPIIIEYRQEKIDTERKKEENIRNYRKKYQEENKDRLNEKKKEWRKNNIEKVRTYEKRWRDKNPEKLKASRNRSMKKEVTEALSAFECIDERFDDKVVISVAEMAAILGIKIHTAYELIKQEGFPSVRVSSQNIVILVENLKQYLNDYVKKNN